MFETIYGWFVSMFGYDLDRYLLGWCCEEEAWIFSNQYLKYGVIALCIALSVTLVYYYVIDHPRFIRWWHWLLMLLLVSFSNFFIGGRATLGDLNSGNIGECFNVFPSDCWMFGLANFFVSAMFFIIFSFCLKWWSTSGKRTPF